jgi:SAM-dependent methyltransferase
VTEVAFSYVDAVLADMDAEGPTPFWRHLHWGLYPDPGRADDSPEQYYAAAEALTDRIVEVAGVAGGRRVLDVGCGFGGTLDHIRGRHRGCRLHGVNIDLRQLRWARRLLEQAGEAGEAHGECPAPAPRQAAAPIGLVAGDGCRLPVADGSVDHVLAVECVFHFPSRKAFLREAARVLRPGGTVALSDFLMAPGALARITATMATSGLGDASWFGYVAKPLTSVGYDRLARGCGFEVVVDDDVTVATLPTYPALRRLGEVADGTSGFTTAAAVEELSQAGDLQYHVVALRRRG